MWWSAGGGRRLLSPQPPCSKLSHLVVPARRVPACPTCADCEHEVQEVASGHRLALVYNLLHVGSGPPPAVPDAAAALAPLRRALQAWQADAGGPEKLCIMLDHQYTQVGGTSPAGPAATWGCRWPCSLLLCPCSASCLCVFLRGRPSSPLPTFGLLGQAGIGAGLRALKGVDRAAGRALAAAKAEGLVDVHLAILEKHETGEVSPEYGYCCPPYGWGMRRRCEWGDDEEEEDFEEDEEDDEEDPGHYS